MSNFASSSHSRFPPSSVSSQPSQSVNEDTPIRDDLFHNPAYSTRLFEILSILQALALQLDTEEKELCPRCYNEICGVVVETCKAWLDNDENIDFPLDPRRKIDEVFGIIDEEVSSSVKLLRLTTALGYNYELNGEPELVNTAMKARIATDGRWYRDACERFIAHVPVAVWIENGMGVGKAFQYPREMKSKIWYLLMGGKFSMKHLLWEVELSDFAAMTVELMNTIVNQDNERNERFCGRLECWPYPDFDLSADSTELFDFLLCKMVKKVRRIILAALGSAAVLRLLAEGTDQLAILSTDDCADWFFEWSGGFLWREGRKLLPVPIGDEDALKGYEVLRMAKIVDRALIGLGLGELGLPKEEQEEEPETMDVDSNDIDEALEPPHPCVDGPGPFNWDR